MSGRPITLMLGTALALVAGSAAHAQSGASQPAAANVVPTPDGDPQEIVVTATRRSEGIQHVPQSVTALTGKDLDQLNAKTLGDFAGYVPGLSVVGSGPSSLIVIRGVTTGSQLSSTVGLYLDEVPLGASTPFGLGGFSFNPNAYDLDRVEVLNGPQGTLFGANSLGGTLRYITAAPDPTNLAIDAETEVGGTKHGGTNYGFRGMVNLPLSDKVALRVSGVEEQTSGYVDDPAHGRTDQGRFRTHEIRGSLLVRPTDNLDIRITGLYQRVPSDGLNNVFLDRNGKPVDGKYQQSYPLAQPAVTSLALISGVVDYQLPFAKLSSITSYQSDYGRNDTDQSLVYDPAFVAFGAGRDSWDLYVNTYTHKFNQELRLASTGHGILDWIVGGYYDSEHTKETVNLYDLSNPGGTLLGLPIFIDTLPSTYREEAIYANATLHLGSKLSIGGGIRYSHQHQTYFQTASGLLATGSSTPSTTAIATTSQSVTTWSVNPRYQVTPDLLLYSRIATGFRPGGPNFALVAGTGSTSFSPDKLTNYEVGVKTSLLDHRATLDVDIYDIEWSHMQLTVNVGGVNQLVNGGDSRIRGAEGAFSYRASHALTVGGSASYTDAKLTTPAAQLDVTQGGARLPFSPRYSFALNGSYSFPLGGAYSGTFTVTDRYLGERNAGFGTAVSPSYRLPGYNTLNFDLALHTPWHLEFDLYMHNVADSNGRISAYTTPLIYNPTSAVPVLLAQPRTVGVVAKFKY